MDKNAIKKFAVWARRELISRVMVKAEQYGITKAKIIDANADSVSGHILSAAEKQQRQALIARISQKGFEQVMEEVAYTWFNRFSALRFMEVNGYLPTRIRVFTDATGAFKPEIMAEAIHLDMDGLDVEKVYTLKEANRNEELYKYLLITQCNALSAILPGMFQKIDDYTELLFPDNLLREGSVLEQMIALIPEDNWNINALDEQGQPQGQVQIIGWLYQYYNTEPKDKVFADLKKNIKISKENIPAATQLFTPDWIVRYMVENSLGRLWIEGHPNDALKSGWKYYLDEAEQEPDVQAQLAEIRRGYAGLKPEDIRCIDPCMGSGHILVYMFDVLMQIYETYGYRSRDAVASIVRNNLYGLDIDDRAAQLAYFSVMMKARQYDSRFLTRGIAPNVYAIRESNRLDPYMVEAFIGGDTARKKAIETIVAEMHDAKEYGSILNVTPQDFTALYARVDEMQDEISMFTQPVWTDLLPLIRVAEALAQKYDVVVTNPPYMGSSGMDAKLGEYVKKNYPDSKSDLFAVFIERCGEMLKARGYQAMITQHAWMYISSYEALRYKLLNYQISSLVHLGIKAFEDIGNDVVQTCSFIFRRIHSTNYLSTFIRLVDCKNFALKEQTYLAGKYRFIFPCKKILMIPGYPFAYWVGNEFINNFTLGKCIESFGSFTGSQNVTGDNDRFLRYYWEVNYNKIGNRWRFYAKGGDYRQYYGNIELVVDWSESARHFYKTNKTSNMLGQEYWYKEGITYSAITSRGTGFRYLPSGCIFDKGGPSICIDECLIELLALLNSNVAKHYFWVFNPSINLQVRDIKNLPIILVRADEVEKRAKESIELCRQDWDAFENSCDFMRSPLLVTQRDSKSECHEGVLIPTCYDLWKHICDNRFYTLKRNEEWLNDFFIKLYELQNELTPVVEERDVTVRRADLKRDICSLISYAVGCMFGRYSLDADGLAYAGGEWDAGKYSTFPADKDNIIPICDDEYFDDDITGRFVRFIETVYGKDTLEENLRFIADALGGNGSPRDIIRSYFLNDFYADHLKIYQKRPIYWLFDSGKKNGFKALIYMHRYAPDTIARMRTDYVHEQQARYRTAIADLERRIASASAAERVKLSKMLTKLQDQSDEIRAFEEKIHHLADQMIRIDLDDGVKHNYEIFGDVLAKIK